jgi:hypothetical protein
MLDFPYLKIKMNDLATDIAKMEYGRLSAEISSIQAENSQLARFGIIANATICAVAVTSLDKILPYFHLLKVLPFIVSCLFSFRVYALFRRVELISLYMEKHFESEILKPVYRQLGWETHLNENIRKLRPAPSFAQVSAILFWIALDALSFIYIFI